MGRISVLYSYIYIPHFIYSYFFLIDKSLVNEPGIFVWQSNILGSTNISNIEPCRIEYVSGTCFRHDLISSMCFLKFVVYRCAMLCPCRHVCVCAIQLILLTWVIDNKYIFEFQVAKNNFDPELIIYNAGTDILDGDPLGRLKVLFFLFIHCISWVYKLYDLYFTLSWFFHLFAAVFDI